MKSWTKTAGVGCGGLLGLTVLLAALGALIPEPEGGGRAAAPTPTATTVAAPPPAPSPTPTPTAAPTPATQPSSPTATPTPTEADRIPPTPTPAQARAYLDYIARIDPGLVASEERALRRADMICERILNGTPGMTIEEYTVLRLSGGHAQITEDQARKIVKAIRVWCR